MSQDTAATGIFKGFLRGLVCPDKYLGKPAKLAALGGFENFRSLWRCGKILSASPNSNPGRQCGDSGPMSERHLWICGAHNTEPMV